MSVEFILFLVLGLIALSTLFLLKNPKKFILAMIIVMSVWQGGYWLSFIEIDLRFSHILIIILFIYILLHPSKLKWRDRFAVPLFIPISGIIVCGSIAALGAANQGVALGGVFTFIFDYLIIVCIISTIEKPKDVTYLINCLLVALCVQIIIALIQYRDIDFKIGIIDRVSSHLMWWRMHGTFVHPNQFGMFLLFVLPFVFRYLIIVARDRKRLPTVIVMIIFLLGMFTLYTTQNRGSQIALIIGFLVTFIIDIFNRRTRFKKTLVKISIMVLILIAIAMIRYGGRVYYQYFVQRSNIYMQYEGRNVLNQEAIPRIRAALPFGIGMSNYESNIRPGYTVHNLYLLVAAEIGLGVIFIIWLLIYLILKTIKLMRINHYFIYNLGSAYLATLIGFIISSWVGPDWFGAEQIRMSFWILAGIVIGTEKLWHRLENQYLLSQREKAYQYKVSTQ